MDEMGRTTGPREIRFDQSTFPGGFHIHRFPPGVADSSEAPRCCQDRFRDQGASSFHDTLSARKDSVREDDAGSKEFQRRIALRSVSVTRGGFSGRARITWKGRRFYRLIFDDSRRPLDRRSIGSFCDSCPEGRGRIVSLRCVCSYPGHQGSCRNAVSRSV